MSYKTTAGNFRQQVEDQKTQVDNLKSALLRLQQKMAEAESKSDMLIAQHRRARALGKATEASNAMGDNFNAGGVRPHEECKVNSFTRPPRRRTRGPGAGDDVTEKFAAMEKQEEIDRLLEGFRRAKCKRVNAFR